MSIAVTACGSKSACTPVVASASATGVVELKRLPRGVIAALVPTPGRVAEARRGATEANEREAGAASSEAAPLRRAGEVCIMAGEGDQIRRGVEGGAKVHRRAVMLVGDLQRA